MTKSYLLIDSTYRNRLLYPNPASFDIPFQLVNTQVLNPNVFNSVNPISIPYPDYNFQWTNYDASGNGVSDISGIIIGGTASAPILDSPVNDVLNNEYIYTSLYSGTNVFAGMVFIYNGCTDSPYNILNYDPITRVIILDGSIPDFITGYGYNIVNYSKSSKIYINGDFLIRSSTVYLSDCIYLYDIATNEIQPIYNYIPDKKLFLLNQSFSTDWQVSDPYMVISKQQVLNYGSILQFPNNQWYVYTILNYVIEFPGREYTYGQFVYFIPEDLPPTTSFLKAKVIRCNLDGSLVELEVVDIGDFSYSVGTRCLVYNSTMYTNNCAASIIVTETTLAFLCSFNQTIEIMAGNFFFPLLLSGQFTIDVSGNLKMSGNSTIPVRNTNIEQPIDIMTSFYENGVTGIRKIIAINSTSAYVLVQNFSQTLLVRFNAIENTTTQQLKGCTNFLILPFTREGVVGLNFTGTQLTQCQATCYRMTVINLILPNITVNIGSGPLTSAFPFMYLEISNVSNSNGNNKSILYSNNPYTTSVTFVCSVSDVNAPIISRFLKISSDGSSQTIKFSPVDTLRLRVSLPNGDTFQTQSTDYLVPVEPDPRVQIHAVIEIEKL
jgi:hypothetical protein